MIQGHRAFGEVGQHVQFGQGGGAVLQRRAVRRRLFQQFVVQRLFPGQGPFAGAQRLVLEGLEFRGDEAFGVFQGLAADVIVRGLVRLGLAADFDVIAVDPVVADFEVGDAGALPFPRFQVDQVLAGVLAELRSSSSSAS